MHKKNAISGFRNFRQQFLFKAPCKTATFSCWWLVQGIWISWPENYTVEIVAISECGFSCKNCNKFKHQKEITNTVISENHTDSRRNRNLIIGVQWHISDVRKKLSWLRHFVHSKDLRFVSYSKFACYVMCERVK